METKQPTLRKKIMLIQRELEGVAKNATANTGKYEYDYFDINTLIDKFNPLFEKYKVYVIQPLCSVDGKLGINTIIRDEESDDEESYPAPITELSDPQKQGGAITYFRRYALVALFMVKTLDDDAGHASGHTEKPTFTPKMQTQTVPGKAKMIRAVEIVNQVKGKEVTIEVGDTLKQFEKDGSQYWVCDTPAGERMKKADNKVKYFSDYEVEYILKAQK